MAICWASSPPSTVNTEPVEYAAASDARNTKHGTRSSTVEIRRSGICSITARRPAVAGQVRLDVAVRGEVGEQPPDVRQLAPRPLGGEYDGGPVGRERPGDAQPDPLAAAGHEGGLAGEHRVTSRECSPLAPRAVL